MSRSQTSIAELAIAAMDVWERDQVGMASEAPAPLLDTETRAKVEQIRDRFGKIKQKSKPQWLHCGRWLRSGVVRYTDLEGMEREWEMVERTTTDGGSNGVDVVATIEAPQHRIEPQSPRGRHSCKKICLVAVYRPPVNRMSLEFPAGLRDKGESVEQAAVRELAEETGFEGRITRIGPTVYIDPWKSSESTTVCKADVCVKENEVRPQQLDEDENLEHLELPLDNLLGQLELLCRGYGFVMDEKLYCFALGLHMASDP